MRHSYLMYFVLFALLFANHAARAEKPTADAIKAGIVWWPADPSSAVDALGTDFEDCIAKAIHETAPEVVFARQRAIRNALFPLLEPATQPENEAAFASLLEREDVRSRLLRRGLRYLIAFSGGTRKEQKGGIICSAGYGGGGCMGFAWRNETTNLSAAIWSLDSAARLHHETVKVEGTSLMPAFVFPIPLLARTEATACRELGNRIGTAIYQTEKEPANTPKPD